MFVCIVLFVFFFLEMYSFKSEDNLRLEAFPSAYALLDNKEKKTYLAIFRCLNSLLGNHKFDQLTSDFESGLFGAADITFDTEKITGCSFHMFQAINRKIGKLGLKKYYNANNENFDIHLRELIDKTRAVAFVPSEFKEYCIECLFDDYFLNNINNNCKYCGLFKYLKATWLEENALFKRNLWDISNPDLLTTNNATEGVNNRLNQCLSNCIAANTWIQQISKEETQVTMEYKEMKSKPLLKLKRKKSREIWLKRTNIINEMKSLDINKYDFNLKFDQKWQKLALSLSECSSSWNILKDLHTDAFLGKTDGFN